MRGLKWKFYYHISIFVFVFWWCSTRRCCFGRRERETKRRRREKHKQFHFNLKVRNSESIALHLINKTWAEQRDSIFYLYTRWWTLSLTLSRVIGSEWLSSSLVSCWLRLLVDLIWFFVFVFGMARSSIVELNSSTPHLSTSTTTIVHRRRNSQKKNAWTDELNGTARILNSENVHATFQWKKNVYERDVRGSEICLSK